MNAKADIRQYALNTSKSSVTVFDLTKTNSSQFKSNNLRKAVLDLQGTKSNGDVVRIPDSVTRYSYRLTNL